MEDLSAHSCGQNGAKTRHNYHVFAFSQRRFQLPRPPSRSLLKLPGRLKSACVSSRSDWDRQKADLLLSRLFFLLSFF